MELLIRFEDENADTEELDRATTLLLRAIHDAGATATRVRAEPLPEGAMGELFTLGALAIAVTPVLLRQIIQLLDDWKLKAPTRRVVLQKGDLRVEFTNDTSVTFDRVNEMVRELGEKKAPAPKPSKKK